MPHKSDATSAWEQMHMVGCCWSFSPSSQQGRHPAERLPGQWVAAAAGSLPTAMPRVGSGGRSHGQDSAIHRHSINKSALLFCPGDKQGGHERAFPCAVCAERGSLCWLPKELRHCCCGTCCRQAENGAAGCQQAPRLEPHGYRAL